MEGVREFRGGNLQAEGIMGMGRNRENSLLFKLAVAIAVTFLFLTLLNFVGSFCDILILGGRRITAGVLRVQAAFFCCRIIVSGNVLLVCADRPVCRVQF